MSKSLDATRAALLDQAPDAIVFAGRDGLILEWNRAAERVFGHARADVLGRSLDVIIPEEFRAAHWRAYDRALAAGETKYSGQALPTRAVRGDGVEIYVELTFAIIRDSNGRAIGALAHARDVTERWVKEREQRRELRRLRDQLGLRP